MNMDYQPVVEKSHKAKWRNARIRATVAALSVLAFFVFPFVGTTIAEKSNSIAPGIAGLILGVASAVAGTSWNAGFRCPRCNGYFYAGWWYVNVFKRTCPHCGLKKGA